MMDEQEKKQQMKKRMRIMLISVAILFGCIIAYKLFITMMIKSYISKTKDPIQTVSTMEVKYSEWLPEKKATGSLRAIKGVNVTTELPGMIQKIYFVPGTTVKKDDVLVQLNVDADIAQLNALKASEQLAKTNLTRDLLQFKVQAVSKAVVESDAANLKNFSAQVSQQQAIIAKKTITAPFSGRLGISAVNPGQYLNTGDKVVSLQQLDPLYLDFYMPQQFINEIKLNQTVRTSSESFPGKIYRGKVTTIDPIVDSATRNVEVEAIISNPNLELVPGMFSEVIVSTGKAIRYLTLPHSAVTFNPYGDIIFKVSETKNTSGQAIRESSRVTHTNEAVKTVTQNFVTTGDTRGDQIAILEGLKEGDVIVTSGQLKLKNGSRIEVNNTVAPANNPNPTVDNE